MSCDIGELCPELRHLPLRQLAETTPSTTVKGSVWASSAALTAVSEIKSKGLQEVAVSRPSLHEEFESTKLRSFRFSAGS